MYIPKYPLKILPRKEGGLIQEFDIKEGDIVIATVHNTGYILKQETWGLTRDQIRDTVFQHALMFKEAYNMYNLLVAITETMRIHSLDKIHPETFEIIRCLINRIKNPEEETHGQVNS